MLVLGWNDIGYSFVIGEDGQVYEGVGWQKLGTHTTGIYNPTAHGISIIGNFMEVLPDKVATDAAKYLMECGVQKVSDTNFSFHVLSDPLEQYYRWQCSLMLGPCAIISATIHLSYH